MNGQAESCAGASRNAISCAGTCCWFVMLVLSCTALCYLGAMVTPGIMYVDIVHWFITLILYDRNLIFFFFCALAYYLLFMSYYCCIFTTRMQELDYSDEKLLP